jgi:hypothetical protein
MMHNGQLASPLNAFAKEMKKLTSKKNKTDNTHMQMAYLEWLGGLYTSEGGQFTVLDEGLDIQGFGVPSVPGEAIEATLINAAKKNKLGLLFKAGVFVDGNFPVEYKGPKRINELIEDENFRDSRLVVVSKSRIVRTRPIFRDWGLKFTVSYLPEVVDGEKIKEALDVAGQMIGLLDYRPKFGRFEVLKVQ